MGANTSIKQSYLPPSLNTIENIKKKMDTFKVERQYAEQRRQRARES